MKPFLQLVHVSDFHFATYQEKERIGKIRRALKRSRVPNLIQEKLLHGLSGHDAFAPRRLQQFFDKQLFPPPWDRLPAWIVNTGDNSTWGSNQAVGAAQDLFEKITGRNNAEAIDLFGNHDAWPSKFPLLSKSKDISKHRDLLRRKLFCAKHPTKVQGLKLPSGAGSVGITSLNSVLHEKVRNTLALGEIKEDYYQGDSALCGVQLEALRKNLQQINQRHDIKLLFVATHHPVMYPEKYPLLSMKLLNGQEVADSVHGSLEENAASAFISGHTHSIYPGIGEFQAEPPMQFPLNRNQYQFVSGTTMQENRSRHEDRPNWPQLLTVFRLFEDPEQPLRIKLERSLAGRHLGQGPYVWVQDLDEGGVLSESISFTFDMHEQ